MGSQSKSSRTRVLYSPYLTGFIHDYSDRQTAGLYLPTIWNQFNLRDVLACRLSEIPRSHLQQITYRKVPTLPSTQQARIRSTVGVISIIPYELRCRAGALEDHIMFGFTRRGIPIRPHLRSLPIDSAQTFNVDQTVCLSSPATTVIPQ